MKQTLKHHGVVVPMITPVKTTGELDEAAVSRLVDSLQAGGVEGIFVLGTTGEARCVPRSLRRRLVELVAASVGGRCLVYAGLGDVGPGDFATANEYYQAGASAVVVHPPVTTPVPRHELAQWYLALIESLLGSVILYNIPLTTGVSIPLDTVAVLADHPKVIGIKDSENDRSRHAELLRRFGQRQDFSVFVGVGALMAHGLRLGADGIVPSVGNLIPAVCHDLCVSAQRGDWNAVETHFARMTAVAELYQRGRDLGQSLAALKAALHHRGVCTPEMLPPLQALSPKESASIREQMLQLQLLP